MSSKDVTIVVSAYTISDKRIEDYVRWNRDIFESENVSVLIVSDRPLNLDSYSFDHLVYPDKLKQMAVSKLLNYGIRSFEDDRTIIRSDIDIVFSKEVIQQVKGAVTKERGILCISANAPSFEQIKNIDWPRVRKRRSGHGACVALHRTTWHQICGYNENLFGWGFEDTDLLNRAKRAVQVSISSRNPLFHIKHTMRVNNNNFPRRNGKNKRIARMGWSNRNWGLISSPLGISNG